MRSKIESNEGQRRENLGLGKRRRRKKEDLTFHFETQLVVSFRSSACSENKHPSSLTPLPLAIFIYLYIFFFMVLFE